MEFGMSKINKYNFKMRVTLKITNIVLDEILFFISADGIIKQTSPKIAEVWFEGLISGRTNCVCDWTICPQLAAELGSWWIF